MDKKRRKLAVIIPTYNEKDNISKLIIKISEIFRNNRINAKIIIVDDDSPDGTGEIADKFAKAYPVVVLHRKKDRGYGNSIREGVNYAVKIDSDVIITLDSDFSHNPAEIPKMLSKIEEGVDVVIGSRRVAGGKIVGWNLWRHFCSSGAMNFSRFVLGLKTLDVTSGFRAYKKEVIEKIPFYKIKSNGYSFLEELLFYIEKSKFKIAEIPIVFVDRKKGKSKLSKKEIINFFINMIRIKSASVLESKTFFKFLIVGLIGILINTFSLLIFKSFLAIPLMISGLLAIELSVISNFSFNNLWTFSDRNTGFGIFNKFFRYHLSVLIGITINYLLLLLLSSYGLYYLISNIIGIFFGTICNYLLSSRWAWREK
ncbi:MAG: glycosyltransferase family 2 protein [Nanoarchaeota archaeon]